MNFNSLPPGLMSCVCVGRMVTSALPVFGSLDSTIHRRHRLGFSAELFGKIK